MINLKDECWIIGVLQEWLDLYHLKCSPEDVIAAINAHLENHPNDKEFGIFVEGNGWKYILGVHIYTNDYSRCIALYPFVYNTTVSNLTGDDWESDEIYSEELDHD